MTLRRLGRSQALKARRGVPVEVHSISLDQGLQATEVPSGELSERNELRSSGGPKVNRRVENELGTGRKPGRSGVPVS